MTGKIKLVHSGGNAVSIAVPTSNPSSSEVEFKLPQADGSSGQALVTDSSGNLSFAGTGKILQVKQTVKLDAFSTTSTSLVDVTGLSVSITPSATSSKVLVRCCVAMSTYSQNLMYAQLLRGSTFIGEANEAGNRVRPTLMMYQAFDTTLITQNFEFLDSPNTTSATTYKVQLRCATTGYAYVNRTYTDTNGVDLHPRLSSTITAMEVAA